MRHTTFTCDYCGLDVAVEQRIDAVVSVPYVVGKDNPNRHDYHFHKTCFKLITAARKPEDGPCLS